jgi:hypothetical protein
VEQRRRLLQQGPVRRCRRAHPTADWTWDDFLGCESAHEARRERQSHQYGYFVPGHNFGLAPWLLTNDTDKLQESVA